MAKHNPLFIKLAKQYRIDPRRIKLIWKPGMSELALRCFIGEIKSTKRH